MRLIVVDLEATCWDGGARRGDMEIIEIGAVALAPDSHTADAEFQSFVKPVVSRHLSQFCMTLSGIRRENVDGADIFPLVFNRFIEWMGDGDRPLWSWGLYDLRQLQSDCRRHGLLLPRHLEERHVDLKKLFAERLQTKRCGMAKALSKLDLPPGGPTPLSA